MRRHPIFISTLILLILTGNQQLRADDRLPSQPRRISRSTPPYDQITGKYLPYKPIRTNSKIIIEQWSAASQIHPSLSPQSKVDEFKKGNRTYFSGHELSLISEFQQPVHAQKLLSDYDWRVVKQTKTTLILRGQPRDVLTRHLCRPFELRINTQSMLPEALTFLSDPAKQKQGFASIELTANKAMQLKTLAETNSHPQSVLRTVAKAVFLPDGKHQSLISTMGPIKNISFSQSYSENIKTSELREIEKLVSRWIAESERIDSIKLGNGVLIFKLGDNRQANVPQKRYTKPDGTYINGNLPYQSVLQPWLIDVDQKTFIIESFAIELSTDDKSPSAPRIITLNIKPNPTSPPNDYQGDKWDAVEIVFNTEKSLPVKITETRNNRVSEFLLSDMQVRYKK
ncbi:hypothetical protein [uncultured Gimesia sp.]|uniref:hypothetical protein n=1 Tax=uncultured Gimesia sp. TaxID=1678688 RepID=UPI00260EEA1B|nr:hypothetical protein [uncultured Gimesia sp.]